jgi:PAS domain S-box-containing protein
MSRRHTTREIPGAKGGTVFSHAICRGNGKRHGWSALMKTLPELTAEQRFQLLMGAMFDYAVFFTDPEGGICEWSRSAQKLIGYTADEALRMNGRVIFTDEDRAKGAPELEMERAVRDGQANDERWHLRKDGSGFFAVGRLVALRNDEDRLVGFAKIIRDATPHKKLELALRASDEHFRATFGQAPIGMVLSDLRGRIQQVNVAFARMLGFEQRELEGGLLLSLTAPEDRAVSEAQLQDMFAGRRDSVSLEKRVIRADGSHLWVQNSAAILRDAESRPLSLIDLLQDITPLKLSESELSHVVDQRTAALLDKTRQMEAFCYTVAHDLRAPLRAIAGYAALLRQDFMAQLPSEGMDYIRRIEGSAARLDRLISDLLGYTRMQQVPVHRDEVDLSDVVGRAADHVKADNPAFRVNIHIKYPLGVVRSDSTTLEHVFSNLFSNAVKFRREGVAPEIFVYSERRADRVRVWVEDNGIGVDPRFSQRIFGMFERLNPDRKIPGTGVGLAIVATAMERLGGDRGVEPNHPSGSRFWVELPL